MLTDPAHDSTAARPPSDEPSLDDSVITGELQQRPSAASDFRVESQALTGLMKVMKEPAANVFPCLAETALRLCRGHSAGVSIVEPLEGRPVMRCHGAAGSLAGVVGQTLEREAGPVGLALVRGTPLLMAYPDRHQAGGCPARLPVAEALVVPFMAGDACVGAVWVLLHDDSRGFDREDLRLLTNLAEYASVGYQLLQDGLQMRQSLAREQLGLQLLQTVSEGLARQEDVEALHGQILGTAMTIMRAPCASMRMMEEGTLRLLAWRGCHPVSAQVLERVRLDFTSESGRALLSGRRYLLTDLEAGGRHLPRAPDVQELRRSSIRALQATPLLSRSGELIGILSTHWHEPHEPCEAELRLFDVLARLAVDLIERARSDRAMREADRRKNEFLAMLSHELRNPLMPLTSGVEILRHAAGQPEIIESLHGMMTRQLAHLTRLVNDLLDLSRISRGTVELQCAPVEVSAVIEAAAELAGPLIGQRGHRFVLEEDGRSLFVHGDMARLTQVISNVLNNAARYTDPGGRIALAVGATGEEVAVRITDTGVGIAQDKLEAVFEMFTQVPGPHARSGGGLGVGLALARRLIELHGGSITARSAGPGRGSEFLIRLPRIAAPVQAAVLSQDRPHATRTRRVLIIEDNEDAASTLRVALESAGHAVRAVHDAAGGLAALASFAPDTVLLDIGLPDLDGYETARRIRALPGGGALRLIAITGWGQVSDRERARQAGFDVHLTKPVTSALLRRTLAEVPPGGGGAPAGLRSDASAAPSAASPAPSPGTASEAAADPPRPTPASPARPA